MRDEDFQKLPLITIDQVEKKEADIKKAVNYNYTDEDIDHVSCFNKSVEADGGLINVSLSEEKPAMQSQVIKIVCLTNIILRNLYIIIPCAIISVMTKLG